MRTPRFIKRAVNRLGQTTFEAFARYTYRLSPETMMKRSRALALFYYCFGKRRIKAARKNLFLAFGDAYSEKERNGIIKETLTNFVYEFFMFFWLDKKGLAAIDVDVEGEENMRGACARGKGVIFLTAHLGNWEILGRKIADMGVGLSVVARNSDRADTTELTNRIRNSGGYKVYDKNASLSGIIHLLRNGEGLGILPDQHDYKGIDSRFFGLPAKTSVGTAAFSLQTGASIVPCFCVRNGLLKYTVSFYPPIEFDPSGDREKDRAALTQLVNDAIEQEIRRHPSSWLWIHDRWKEYTGGRIR